jgi:hypothetical protein
VAQKLRWQLRDRAAQPVDSTTVTACTAVTDGVRFRSYSCGWLTFFGADVLEIDSLHFRSTGKSAW